MFVDGVIEMTNVKKKKKEDTVKILTYRSITTVS